ncbi:MULTISPECIES: MerR family transcriptional regulator [unclassified Pseudofrankia]|uniref:MerR family transcriptional regulator n=1 Tax=unclassified Pseudofrankia TaxID=2994372 RepID=UPI0008DA95D6|nr:MULTISPECIES: MerR family transcriptional regulator [unclassified Pseudofrankia]MDT3439431.1 MerR family transcriptional regulator [Pseudofrankia sp. BMG5.37]OHV48820.1 MerR family transcriptional regulator [Pseudofrankia sp. BMG5.36]
MKIGELSRRTGVPARMLRYYEEQGLLSPERADNGYRAYPESTVDRVRQIRGLLDCGLTTEIIRAILPCLDQPEHIYLLPENLNPRTLELLHHEVARIQQRIDCLTRNRDAVLEYLAAAQSGVAPCAGNRRSGERPAPSS